MRRAVIEHMGGLYWRLTASYVSVTLLAALIILCAMVLSPSIQQLSQMSVLPQQTLQKVTEIQVAPLLEKSAGDHTSLLYWGAIPTFDEIKRNGIPQVLLVSIFSRDGQVLVSTIQGQRFDQSF